MTSLNSVLAHFRRIFEVDRSCIILCLPQLYVATNAKHLLLQCIFETILCRRQFRTLTSKLHQHTRLALLVPNF